MATFSCSFGDNYSPISYDIYWEVTHKDGNDIVVEDDMDLTNFNMSIYQDCPSYNYSCCQFTTTLSIHTNISMDNAVVTCNAQINEFTSDSSSDLSELMWLTCKKHSK